MTTRTSICVTNSLIKWSGPEKIKRQRQEHQETVNLTTETLFRLQSHILVPSKVKREDGDSWDEPRKDTVAL